MSEQVQVMREVPVFRAAGLLGVSPERLVRLVDEGRIKADRLGGKNGESKRRHLRFSSMELEDLLRELEAERAEARQRLFAAEVVKAERKAERLQRQLDRQQQLFETKPTKPATPAPNTDAVLAAIASVRDDLRVLSSEVETLAQLVRPIVESLK